MYYIGMMDSSYIFVIIGIIITLLASAHIKNTYARYDKVSSRRGITGAECARRILDANGLRHIQIRRISGSLTDNFDPRNNIISLSDATYASSSIAALGVAAHECGHAVQHQAGYVPIKIRNGIVPFVNICSHASLPLIFIGLILGWANLAMLGIVLYCAVFAFQLVTIPTETNASARALKTLESMAILDEDEIKGAKKVLTAAAMTYFASAASTALQILRLLMLVSGGSRNRR